MHLRKNTRDIHYDKSLAHFKMTKSVQFGAVSRFALYLLAMGVLFCGILYPLAMKEYEKQTSAYVALLPDYSPIVPPVPHFKGKPVKLEIPSLGISLRIIDGSYDAITHTWTLSHDKGQFDTSSTLANNRDGNTFIYGHATEAVFGPLLRIQPDALALITTDNGLVFTYKLTSHEVVDPNNTAVLNYTGPSRLMLQTCTGPTLSEYRQLFYFSYVEHSRPQASPVQAS